MILGSDDNDIDDYEDDDDDIDDSDYDHGDDEDENTQSSMDDDNNIDSDDDYTRDNEDNDEDDEYIGPMRRQGLPTTSRFSMVISKNTWKIWLKALQVSFSI